MKSIRIISLISLAFITVSLISQSQDVKLSQTNESGIYKKGEKISVLAIASNHEGDSLSIRVLKNNKEVLLRKVIMTGNDSLKAFEGAYDAPCSIIIEVRTKKEFSAIGLVVDPKKLKPATKCPKDFDSYWDLQKNNLKSIPLEVRTTRIADSETVKGYTCVNTEIICPGSKPARGYFAKPEKAAPKSLPIVLLVHAAGVKGSWCRSEPQNALNYAKKGTLCFDLNAHGMLNGQPESYYDSLEKGELHNYYLQGLTSRDEFYFRGMYLRLLQTIEYLTRQPEWDGRRILVIGESQGGGQALVAAGLDRRVSAVVALVPAMCDWTGSLAGRMGGWPQPLEADADREKMLKTLPYFDAVNILKRSKAIIFSEIGLIDMTCPASSVFTAINQAKGKKITYAVPYRPHQQPHNALTEIWQERVYKPREKFINDYIK